MSMLFAASCAQGVDDETFSAGVTNAQLESPAADSFAVTFVTDANGAEQVKVTWPVVVGAGGYLCSVWNVNDPNNPEVILENYKNDGAALYFPLVEDSNYKVTVQTLGNEKYGNKDALSTTEVDVKTMIDGIPVPVGSDVGEFITKYITDNAEKLAKERAANPNFEIAFDLVGGETYTMAVDAKSDVQPIRVRGDRYNRPTLQLLSSANFEPANGLKLKFLNIDATGLNQTNDALIIMPEAPENGIKGEKTYLCQKPIRIETCWINNLGRSLINGGNSPWGVVELRVADCIIQLNMACNGAHKTFINMFGNADSQAFGGSNNNYGGIQNMFFVNSTIYNIFQPEANNEGSAYFYRGGNADLAGTFGANAGQFTVRDCTFGRMVPNKNAADRMCNKDYFIGTFENTIWYDCWRIQKFKQGSAVWSFPNTTFWNVTMDPDNTDKGLMILEDPGFGAKYPTTALDFGATNGGVDFKPSGEKSSAIGDPRWL